MPQCTLVTPQLASVSTDSERQIELIDFIRYDSLQLPGEHCERDQFGVLLLIQYSDHLEFAFRIQVRTIVS